MALEEYEYPLTTKGEKKESGEQFYISSILPFRLKPIFPRVRC